MAKRIKLEWWNECDLGLIYYAGNYRNTFYYETEIGKPSYEVDQSTEENGDAVDVILAQTRKKIYQVEVYVPEYMVDALVDMSLHDNIRISTTDGLYASAIRNVEVVPSWEDISTDCMATVVIRFQQDDQLVDNACCSPLDVLACLTSCKTVAGFRDAHSLNAVQGQYYIESYTSPMIYIYDGVEGWTESPCTGDNPYVFNSELNIEMYWNGTQWYEAPEMITVSSINTGTDWQIYIDGFALPNTFVQGYASPDGVTYTAMGDPVSAEVFLIGGLIFNLPNLNYFVKVYMYNHNCQYQFSSPQELT